MVLIQFRPSLELKIDYITCLDTGFSVVVLLLVHGRCFLSVHQNRTEGNTNAK